MKKTILITGGTGFFGRAFIDRFIDRPDIEKIIVFSRDEHKQNNMPKHPKLRFFIGDVRDETRLHIALEDVDEVYHAAAMKVVPTCEYNPIEAVETNVNGTINVVRNCIFSGRVKKAVLISTDKAVEPINLYGATKACAEKVWIHANVHRPIFQAVRYGNVMGSTGSVLPLWKNILAEGKDNPLPITDVHMTRFWVDIRDAVDFAYGIPLRPGTINVLKMKAFKLVKLASALYKRHKLKEIGIRPGEKIHETIINSSEARRATIEDYGSVKYFCIHQDAVGKLCEPITSTSTELNANDLIALLGKMR